MASRACSFVVFFAATSIIVRLIFATTIATAFAPDEFWQGPEVAHRLVFGYGHLTWEWAIGLRSYVHPLLYAIIYWPLALLRLDGSWIIAKSPAILQSILATINDVAIYGIALEIFGHQVAFWTAVCQMFSWFNLYCMSRSYSSSVEAFLTSVGVFWLIKTPAFHLPASHGGQAMGPFDFRWKIAAAICTVFRPPSGLFWLGVAVWYLAKTHVSVRKRAMLEGLAVGGVVFLSSMLVDRICYERWIPVLWNFFKFNLLDNGSAVYGEKPWLWNFYSGVPSILASYIPLFGVGLACSYQKSTVAKLLLLELLVYSLPSHKEIRFLLPALQLAFPYCGKVLDVLLMWAFKQKGNKMILSLKIRRAAVLMLVFLQIPLTVIFCFFHQRGQIDIISLIRKKAAQDDIGNSILFLTPCHSTPYYSYIHRPVPMRFIDCSPPGLYSATEILNLESTNWLKLPTLNASFTSQREHFESDPKKYLSAIFKLNSVAHWPRMIVAFDDVLSTIHDSLERHGYFRAAKFWNCFVPADESTSCYLDLYERRL